MFGAKMLLFEKEIWCVYVIIRCHNDLLTHHPRTTIVEIFVTMHESYVKMCVFVLRLQGHQAYNRFVEGKKGFSGVQSSVFDTR